MDTLASRLADAMGRMQAPELAAKVGVTKQTIYNLLDGVTKADKVRAVTLFDLAEALGTTPQWLLFGRDAVHISSHATGPTNTCRHPGIP
jgi:transcriptional regulator with XRE-family HTH domain